MRKNTTSSFLITTGHVANTVVNIFRKKLHFSNFGKVLPILLK